MVGGVVRPPVASDDQTLGAAIHARLSRVDVVLAIRDRPTAGIALRQLLSPRTAFVLKDPSALVSTWWGACSLHRPENTEGPSGKNLHRWSHSRPPTAATPLATVAFDANRWHSTLALWTEARIAGGQCLDRSGVFGRRSWRGLGPGNVDSLVWDPPKLNRLPGRLVDRRDCVPVEFNVVDSVAIDRSWQAASLIRASARAKGG